MKGALYLEDGSIFPGEGFGDMHMTRGETVFFTGMTGTQEVISHPAYAESIVVMTYPMIGNWGINTQGEQSPLNARAVIVRDLAETPSNWRSEGNFINYCEKRGIAGLKGVDTRALTCHLRENGVLKGIVTYGDKPEDLTAFDYEKSMHPSGVESFGKTDGRRALVLDYGLDKAQIENLKSALPGFRFEMVTPCASVSDIMVMKPELVIVACGVFDSSLAEPVIALIRSLIGTVPLYGEGNACLMLGVAAGYRLKKLRFGHHGLNHPVREIARERVYMTEQHHIYNLHGGAPGALVSHENVNDQSIEGFIIPGKIVAAQFAPQYGGVDSGSVYNALRRMVHADGQEGG